MSGRNLTINVRNYPNVWFTSDWHLGHNKEFLYGPRGCTSRDEHTRKVIDGINKQSCHEDLIIHLGDLALTCTYEEMLDALIELKCENIWFVTGNHDNRVMKLRDEYTRYFDCGLQPRDVDYRLREMVGCKRLRWLGKMEDIVIQEPSDVSGKKDHKKNVTLNHFPMLLWDKSHHGAFHLCGHTHGSLPQSRVEYYDAKRLDVGVDNALEYNNTIMFNWGAIKSIMNRKTIQILDHHNRNTT